MDTKKLILQITKQRAWDMNMQTRKLELIGFLYKLQDEVVLKKLEDTVRESQLKNLNGLTKEELILRAKRANEDFVAGRVKSQEQVEREMEQW